MIAAQPRERRPALRAAVPAAPEIPDHLDPGQVRAIPPPARAPGPRLFPVPVPAPCPPGPEAASLPGGSGRDRSDDRPNTSRCNTARSARSLSISATCPAFSARSRALSARSSPASRASSRFASSAAASTSRSDASAPSESGTTPATTATRPSKHPQQPLRTPASACRSPQRSWTPTPRHTISEYLRQNTYFHRTRQVHCCDDLVRLGRELRLVVEDRDHLGTGRGCAARRVRYSARLESSDSALPGGGQSPQPA